MSKKLTSALKNLTFFAISIGLLVYVFSYMVDWQDMAQSLREVSYLYLIPIFAMAMFTYWVENYKFGLFAKMCGKISFFQLFPIFMTGMLFNSLTPGARSGGEIMRGYYLSLETKCDPCKSVAASYVSSATYALTFLIIAFFSTILTIFLVDLPSELNIALFIVGVSAIALAIILYFLYTKHHLLAESKLVDLVLKLAYWIAQRHKYDTYELFKAHVIMNFSKFLVSWADMFKMKRLVAQAMIIDFFAIIAQFAKVFFIFLAFGKVVNPLIIIAVCSVAQLIGFFLILPGGIGVTEASMIPMYIAFGISPGIGAAVTIVDRATHYLATYGAGGFFFGWLSIKHNLRSGVRGLLRRAKNK